RASLNQVNVSLRLVGVPKFRQASPPTGCSTFSTSAPNSPRIEAQYGAAITVATSMTRMPLSGSSSCSWFMLDDPLLPQPADLGGGEAEEVVQHLGGCVAEPRPEVADVPRGLGQPGDDVGHDHRAELLLVHLRQVAARPEVLVLEDVGDAVELADGDLSG